MMDVRWRWLGDGGAVLLGNGMGGFHIGAVLLGNVIAGFHVGPVLVGNLIISDQTHWNGGFQVVLGCGCSELEISREKCSEVGISKEKCSEVEISREKWSEIEISREKCSEVEISREKCSEVEISREKWHGEQGGRWRRRRGQGFEGRPRRTQTRSADAARAYCGQPFFPKREPGSKLLGEWKKYIKLLKHVNYVEGYTKQSVLLFESFLGWRYLLFLVFLLNSYFSWSFSTTPICYYTCHCTLDKYFQQLNPNPDTYTTRVRVGSFLPVSLIFP